MHRSLLSLKRGIVFVTLVAILLMGLSVQGQGEPNPEGTPSETATTATLITSPTDTPTDALPMDMPSESPTTEVTPGQTAEASATSPQPTASLPFQMPVSLPLAYNAPFEPNYPITLNPHTGWDEATITPEGNKALQSNAGAVPILYGATFADSAAEVKFLLDNGEGRVLLRGYAAGVYPGGLVTLYRDQTAVAVTNVYLPDSTWFTLRLDVIGTQLQVSINGVSLIAYTDETPLPQGYAGFAAQNGAMLRADDFAVYGVPTVAAPTATATSMPSLAPSYTPINTSTKTATATAVFTPTSTGTITATFSKTPASTPTVTGTLSATPTATGTGTAIPLLVPSNVQVTLSNQTFTITWTDTNTLETGYDIERHTGFLRKVSANTITFSDANLPCGVTLWYRVRAVAGTSVGPWSGWVAGSTAPCASVCDANAAVQRVSVGSSSQYQSNKVELAATPAQILSEDGRYILFSAASPLTADRVTELAAEPLPDLSDVYRYDTQTCATTKVSLGDSENETTSDTYEGMISPDGNIITFSASSPGLATPSYSPLASIFIRNISQGTTTRLPLYGSNTYAFRGVDMASNGRYILLDQNLTITSLTDTNGGMMDVMLYDTVASTSTVVSVNPAGTATGNSTSWGTQVFEVNGRVYVVFGSRASDLVTGDTNAVDDVFLRDVTGGTTTRISVRDDETQHPQGVLSHAAALVNNTLVLAYVSRDLTYNNNNQVYLRTIDLSAPDQGTTQIVSRAAGVSGVLASTGIQDVRISDNGRWVAFDTSASNLVSGDTNNGFDIFVRDLLTSTTQRVSFQSNGAQIPTSASVRLLAISPNGARVLMTARGALVTNDTNTLCELDYADSDPNTPGTQYDYDDNCVDYYIATNTLYEAPPAPPTPTSTLTSTATSTPTLLPPTNTPDPNLVFSTEFENGYPAQFSNQTWTHVPGSGASAYLQSPAANSYTAYTPGTFTDAEVRAAFKITSGEALLYVRGYAIGLTSAGTARLYRNGVVQGTTTVTLVDSSVNIILKVTGGTVEATISSFPLATLSFTDNQPLAAGFVGFSASGSANVQLDRFTIYGQMTPAVIPTSTQALPTFTRTPTSTPSQPVPTNTQALPTFTGTATSAPTQAVPTFTASQAVPTFTPSRTPGPTITPPAALFYSGFENGYPSALSAQTWSIYAVDQYDAYLRAPASNSMTYYTPATLLDGYMYGMFTLNTGDVSLHFHGYTLKVSHTGDAKLYRNDVLVSTASFPVVGTRTLTLIVNGKQVSGMVGPYPITYSDTTPLPAGFVGFSASDNADVQIDWLEINGAAIPLTPTPISPTSTIVPPSATPTIVPSATDTATDVPPTATLTIEPPTATPTIVPATDTPTDVPPTATPTIVPTTDTPTDMPPTASLTPTSTPTATNMASLTPTSTPTSTATSTPTEIIYTSTATPTVIGPSATPAALFNTGFENGYPSELTTQTWSIVDDAGYGWRAHSPVSSSQTFYQATFVKNGYISAKMSVTSGEGFLIYQGYRIGMAQSGFATLYRGNDALVTSNVSLQNTQNVSVTLYVAEGELHAVIGSFLHLYYTDPAPLGPNFAGFSASDNGIVAIDNLVIRGQAVSINGTPTPTNTLVPSLTPTSTGTVTMTPMPAVEPLLLAPLPEKVIRSTRQPVFSWGASENAVSYEIQIAEDENFNPVFVTQTVTSTTFTPSVRLAQGRYVWHVRALNSAGLPSAWSPAQAFTITLALTPSEGSMIMIAGTATTVNVVFTWTDSRDSGDMYLIEIDDESSFASVDYMQGSSGSSAAFVLPAGTFSWRVSVIKSGTLQPFVGSGPVFNTFNIGAAPPRAVQLVSPLSGAFLASDGALTWSWGTAPEPAGGPFTYDVEISPTSAFTDSVLTRDIFDLSYQPGAMPDKTYFWRVRAVNTLGVPGAWSAARTFVVDTTPPAAPVMISPVMNAIFTTARPTFSWRAVAGATRYQVEVGNTCGDGGPYYVSGLLSTTSHTLPAAISALPQGEMQVCVTAIDAAGNISPLSEARVFTVFLGTAPADKAIIAITGKPRFIWTMAAQVNTTVQYQVQIASDTTFTEPFVYESPLLTTNSYMLPVTLPVGTYFWRVLRVIDDAPEMVLAGVSRTLYVGALTAGPAILTPSASQTVNTLSLTWSDAVAPEGIPITDYEVMLSKSSTFATTVAREIVPVWLLQWTFGFDLNLPRASYYLRLRGLNNGTPVTQWSPRSFFVDTAPPARTTIISPTPDQLFNTVRPTFKWAAVAGATQYWLLALDNVTQQEIINQTVTTTTWTPPYNLPQNRFSFHVYPSDGTNMADPTSVYFAVRLGTAPAQNSQLTTTRPTFTWNAVSGATTYELQIDDEATFDSEYFSDPDLTVLRTIPLGNVTSYTLSVDEALPAGDMYFWRIKASNLDYPIQTDSRMFTINQALTAPQSPYVSSDGSTIPDTLIGLNDSGTFIFRWGELPDVTLYQLQFSRSPQFNTPDTFMTAYAQTALPYRDMADGLWYWRVQGVYSRTDYLSVGPWSSAVSFTVDRVVPDIPIPTAPLPGVSLSTSQPTVKWQAVPGAVKYRLTFVDPLTETPLPNLSDVMVTSTSYTIPAAARLSQNTFSGYRWYLRAEDAVGNLSAVSDVQHFSIFSGLTPTKNLFLMDTTPSFTWAALPGTGSVIFELAAQPTMQAADIIAAVSLPATATIYTIPNAQALPVGQYFWRVYRAGDEIGNLQGQSFNLISSTASITPTPTLPLVGDLVSAGEEANLMFSWQSVKPESGLLDLVQGYEIQIATTSTFTAASIVEVGMAYPGSGSTIEYMHTAVPLPEGLYYWRVRAIFLPEAAAGPYTTARSFTVDRTPPPAAVLSAPVSHDVISNTRMPTFSWAAASTATRYVLEIATEEDFASLRTSLTITTTSYTLPSAQALPNGLYYWRVKAVDTAGNISFAPVRPITIAAP